jgi:hypothetical protein
MAEHIVARALRAQIASIEAELASDPDMTTGNRTFLNRIKEQFQGLTMQLNALGNQPVAGPLGVVVPTCTHDDDCRIFGHPRGPHWLTGGSAVTVDPLAGGQITIRPDRLELAAKTVYTRMAAAQSVGPQTFRQGRMQPVAWELLDERDRQSWRIATTDALRAALEADNG